MVNRQVILNGFMSQTPWVKLMLDYLYLICLLCLTISVPILVRGCVKLNESIPQNGSHISARIDKVAELLDEMADLMNNAIQFTEETSALTPSSSSPIMTLLNAFMTKTPSPPEHGSKTQTEREIYEIIEPQTTQTESESS